MKIPTAAFLALVLVVVSSGTSRAEVWGVNPSAAGAQLVNIDAFTGAISQTYGLSNITANDTEIGLAGWSDALYYINGDDNPGNVAVIDPTDGSTTQTFSISGGWGVDGLGYYADGGGSYLYTSGCSVNDMHRYNATDGAGPQFFWSDVSNPKAVAGDNGGRIFTYATGASGAWGIYMVDPLVDNPASYFAASPSTSIVGMAYDGTYLYLSDLDDMLYTMDNSGTLVNSLDLGYTLYALASTEGVPVPVPGAVLLGALGLGVANWRLKKRRMA